MKHPHSAEIRARAEREHACEEAILALAKGTPPEWARTFAERATDERPNAARTEVANRRPDPGSSPTVSPRAKKSKKSKMAKQQRSLRRSMHPKENRDRDGKQDGSGSSVLADALRAALKPDKEIEQRNSKEK